jgi:hypothetical protein
MASTPAREREPRGGSELGVGSEEGSSATFIEREGRETTSVSSIGHQWRSSTEGLMGRKRMT